jgi:hypothetical protein
MRNRILSLTAAVALIAPLAAQASSITYDFTANGGSFGPLANVISTGSFTFDSSIIPAGGGTVIGTGLLTGLSFTWDGKSYNQTTANTGALAFTPSGLLSGVNIGDSCNASGGCMVDPNGNDWILSGFVFGAPLGPMNQLSTLYTVGDGQSYNGWAHAYLQTSAAPEAGTVTLLLGGLAILLGYRRKPKTLPTC